MDAQLTDDALTVALARLGGGPVRWGACVRDAATFEVLASHEADLVQPTASVGKVLLLVEVARRVSAGSLPADRQLAREPGDAVADSGLWQHLSVPALPARDLAVLVGSVSDNLATNVLLRHVGLDAVDSLAASLGLGATGLHDRVRDVRRPHHPQRLSSGTAAELSLLMARLARGAVVSASVSRQVLDWLATGVDLSMVAAPWGLDPLAHTPSDRGLRLAHKTGTDDGVRADVGLLAGPAGEVAYAVLASWDPAGPDLRDDALAGMRLVGETLLPVVAQG